MTKKELARLVTKAEKETQVELDKLNPAFNKVALPAWKKLHRVINERIRKAKDGKITSSEFSKVRHLWVKTYFSIIAKARRDWDKGGKAADDSLCKKIGKILDKYHAERNS